ncbi:S1C family serine protease [Streptomyces naganishii]|uniref:Protease n=1 Tax=Streptomyces naganishii JCM 4654 TaxID=1306179 RepID=A0A918Y212_9ACTN|nr:trypsin-like peptidase domain-containing protein [Streptomyces naganishii]GHD87235.1 protease [Streptomyces naganishii JCM 4654]
MIVRERPVPAPERAAGPPPAGPARRLRLIVSRGAAAAVLAALAAGCTSGSSGSSGSSQTKSSGPDSGGTPSVSAELQSDYLRVVHNVLPSVVQITTSAGLGSGIVYDDKGDIVTNAHVVGKDHSFSVTFANRQQLLHAGLVGVDPADDLAVIRLDDPPSGLHPAAFADSKNVQVGQIVLAMGNPLGLSSSVTQGIVSAVGRTVSEPAGQGSGGATIPNMVQTSAAINPGNSGGALANLSSQVIGINTLAAVDQELGGAAPGIGFAIPSSTVTRIADQLIKSGKVTNSGRAALGITVRTVLGADSAPAGAGIVAVTRGGAADRAGLKPGDIITELDGTRITDVQTLTEALAAKSPGDQVTIGYSRDGRTATAHATLGTLPTS